jgi:hypothetical protein
VLCKTVVTVTIEHAPPFPAATFVAAALFAPFVLANSRVIVLVVVDVRVRVVVGSFEAMGVAAKFAGAAELMGMALAPAAKFAGAAEVPAAAAVERCK